MLEKIELFMILLSIIIIGAIYAVAIQQFYTFEFLVFFPFVTKQNL